MELSVLYWLQQLHQPILDSFMTAVSSLGNGGCFWVLLALALCIYPRSRKCGIAMLAAMVTGLLAGNVLLKNIVARPRPCWVDPSVPLLIPNPADYSFPSGHTLVSFEAAVTIFLHNRHWGIPALLLAGLIGFSRMYLFVHYPTDVAAGMILGTIIAVIITELLEKEPWKRRKG